MDLLTVNASRKRCNTKMMTLHKIYSESYYKHAEAISYHLTLDQPNLELPQTLRLVLQHHFIT